MEERSKHDGGGRMFREEARIVVVDDVADAAESIASALMLALIRIRRNLGMTSA